MRIIVWSFFSIFGPFLSTVVKNAKHKKVVPGIDLNLCKRLKNSFVDICVPKMCFSKMYIFGAPIESIGPGMVSS